MSTNRIKLVVSYDGTEFCGWAAQSGLRTVQGTLTEAVRRVSGEDVEIVGASRTDGGAHAKGQVCHFDIEVRIEPENWARILSKLLPSDLAVISSTQVNPDFHSRFSARYRHYRYRILSGDHDPLRSRYTHWTWRSLDLDKMAEAAAYLQGRHDFRAYTEELQPHIENTTRTLHSVQVRRVKDEVWFDVKGTAFLRGMMRRMAGVIFEVGKGARPPKDAADLLTLKRDGMHWPVVLPAGGLTLMGIVYGRHPKDVRETASREDLDLETKAGREAGKRNE